MLYMIGAAVLAAAMMLALMPVCIKKLIGYWTVAGIGYGPEFSLL